LVYIFLALLLQVCYNVVEGVWCYAHGLRSMSFFIDTLDFVEDFFRDESGSFRGESNIFYLF